MKTTGKTCLALSFQAQLVIIGPQNLIDSLFKDGFMKKIIASVGALLVMASAYVLANSVEERMAPAGKLCMSGEPCAAAPAAPASAEPRSGSEVYSAKCATCHATGAANAPKLGDAAAWAPRAAKGMDVLYTSAISGFNGMPAKGLCFDCSDDEIKASVDHMVEGSK